MIFLRRVSFIIYAMMACLIFLVAGCSEEPTTFEGELRKLIPESAAEIGFDTVSVKVHENDIFEFELALHLAPTTDQNDGIFFVPLFVSESPVTFLRYPSIDISGYESEMLSVESKGGKYYYILSIITEDTLLVPGENVKQIPVAMEKEAVRRFSITCSITTKNQAEEETEPKVNVPLGNQPNTTVFLVSTRDGYLLKRPQISLPQSTMQLITIPRDLSSEESRDLLPERGGGFFERDRWNTLPERNREMLSERNMYWLQQDFNENTIITFDFSVRRSTI